MITFENITKTYDNGVVGIKDFSLKIQSGEFVVFVGPSGCGKTTTMRMVNKMTIPTSGIIEIDGENIANANSRNLRKNIGYVMQSGGLFPHKKVLENITLGLTSNGTSGPTAKKRGMELLELVGLGESYAKKYPNELSGGQKQRVAVARGLASDPNILLMDEPFSALDPSIKEELQNEVMRLHDELGKTIIFVTHDIDEAIKLGDKIAVFGKGKLEQYTTANKLLSYPKNDDVNEIIGRDRGYRSLSFLKDADIRPERIPLVTQTEYETTIPTKTCLIINENDEPLGWFDPDQPRENNEPADLIRVPLVQQPIADLRYALNAALASPLLTAVLVNQNGQVLGGISLKKIVEQITKQKENHDTLPNS